LHSLPHEASETLTFFIQDKDGMEKKFVVNDDNLADAIDSWMLAYAKQVEEKVPTA